MRYFFVKIMLVVPLLAAMCLAVDPSMEPMQSYSYWSEDMGSGAASYLGVDTRDITADRLSVLQLKEERGVEVTMVDQDAPAGKAGIKEQDVVLTINGEAVQSVEQLRRMIHEIPPGRTLTMGISRNGQPLVLKVQLANRRDFAPTAKDFNFVMPHPTVIAAPEIDVPASIVVIHSTDRSGLLVENMTSQLADFFGAKEGRGILVRSVEKGSFAEKAGFHAGDVITQINGESVSDSGDFAHAIRNRKTAVVSILIVRAKKEQTITLTLPEPKHSGEFDSGVPKIGAELQQKFMESQAQLAQIKPELEIFNRDLERIKPDFEIEGQKMRMELERQGEEMKRNMENMKDQIRLEVQGIMKSRGDI